MQKALYSSATCDHEGRGQWMPTTHDAQIIIIGAWNAHTYSISDPTIINYDTHKGMYYRVEYDRYSRHL